MFKYRKVTIPVGVYGIQLVEALEKIIIFHDKSKRPEAERFAKTILDDTSIFEFCSSDPPMDLELECTFCSSSSCKSITGQYHDIGVRESIGCGSPLLAMYAADWNTICSTGRKPTNITQLKQKLTNGKVYKEWSLGCRMECDNNVCFLSSAHSLRSFNRTEDVVFLSEYRVDNTQRNTRRRNTHRITHRLQLVELGSNAWQLYDQSRALDILVIHLRPDFDHSILSIQVHSSCEESYLDVVPKFDQEPIINQEVVKRGAASGNTFGTVITARGIWTPIICDETRQIQSVQPVEAFAINTLDRNNTPFAQNGDSGSVVFENGRSTKTRQAYGIVWRKQKVYDELNMDYMDKATVCVKMKPCLGHVKDIFGVEIDQGPSTTCNNCNIQYVKM